MARISVPQVFKSIGVSGRIGLPGCKHPSPLDGIYQRRHSKAGIFYVKEKFYKPTNPRTPQQQAGRIKFTAGVAAWKALSPQEKEHWLHSKRAKLMTGRNLFLRNFMLNLPLI